MPIRILHVVDNLGIGGLQNGLSNLVANLDPERFEHVFCAVRSAPAADIQPFPEGRTQWFDLPQNGSRFHARSLANAIRDVRPDIVHSRNWAAIEAVFAGRLVGGVKLVHSEHGLDLGGAAREPWKRTCLRRLAFTMADRVFSVSHQLRDIHAQRTGFSRDRIAVIHNGVDHRRFAPSTAVRAAMRRELGLGGATFAIGCVGNLTPVKDYFTVLSALSSGVLDGRCEWQLLIAGDGPERARLEQFASEQPACRGRVRFLGRTKRVAELLNAIDVYVLSSVTEGICNALLEAMAAGVPALVTATGGNPEVVTADTGLLFPVGDARALAAHLASLSTSQDARVRLGEAGLRRVQAEFSLPAMVSRYDELYSGLAGAEYRAARAASGA